MPQEAEALAQVIGDDRGALRFAALEVPQEAEELARPGNGEAAQAVVPEQEKAGRGRCPFDDGVEGVLLAGVGDLLEAEVEREAALPAGEAAALDSTAAELVAQRIAAGELVGTHDELGLGVERGDGVVVGTEGCAGAVEGDEGTQASVLFEVGDGDAVDVLIGFTGRVDAEEVAKRLAVRVGRRR